MSVKYLGYRLIERMSGCLPQRCLYRCAEQLADVTWRCSARDRAAVQANLSLALGAPVLGRSFLARDVFRNFGRYLIEFFSVHRVPQPDVQVEGYDHLTDAQRPGRGTIVLTAHVGNWEVGAVLIHRMGFPIAPVALPHDDPKMDRLFNEQRTRCGITVIPVGAHAARYSLQHLREGYLLGLLGDQDFSGNGQTVSFNGREVILPRGPALLSLWSQAPIVPTFLIREGDWKFRLCFEQPLWPRAGTVDDASVRGVVQSYVTVLERYLRRFASQWLLFRPIPEARGTPP